MFSWLKKYFYPHDGNDHHPHLLRTEVSSVILSLLLVGEVAFLFSILVVLPNTHFFADIVPNVLVDSTNIERQKINENQLTVSPLLQQAAQAKAKDMATKGYFAHTSPEGITPWYWLQQAGYSYTSAGENLAINYVDSKDVILAWMNSPGHRANILNQNYTEIGIATAKGIYQGQEATFVVQFFGRPDIQPDAVVPVDQPPVPAPTLSPALPVLTLTPTPPITPIASSLPAGNSQVKSETITKTIPPAVTYSSFKDRLLSNPKNLTTDLLLMVVLLFMLTTVFTLLIHNGTIRARAVVNGILVMAIIITLVYFNQYIITSGASIF